MMWMALQRLKPLFLQLLLTAASQYTGVAIEQLATGPKGVWRKADLQACRDSSSPLIRYSDISAKLSEPIAIETKFHYPITPDPIMGGHFLYTYAAVAVRIEVNTLTGRVRLLDQFHAVAAGPVANPQGYLGQIEGGSIMALGFTLTEDAQIQAGEYVTRNLDTYLIPTVSDIHRDFELEAIEELPEEDTYGPRGVGEIGTVILAPAIASAVYHAVGKRITRLPIRPEELQQDFIIPEGVVNDEYKASRIQ
jgi:CO/xanthine dehydrogenase Mo-binding subunit